RQKVLELGQLHLDARLARPGASGEDVQDEPGSIDDFHVELLAEVSALGWGKVVVEKQKRRLLLAGEDAYFFDLSLAEERGRADGTAALQHFAPQLGAGRFGQEAKLGQEPAVLPMPPPRFAAGEKGAFPMRVRSPARRGHG